MRRRYVDTCCDKRDVYVHFCRLCNLLLRRAVPLSHSIRMGYPSGRAVHIANFERAFVHIYIYIRNELSQYQTKCTACISTWVFKSVAIRELNSTIQNTSIEICTYSRHTHTNEVREFICESAYGILLSNIGVMWLCMFVVVYLSFPDGDRWLKAKSNYRDRYLSTYYCDRWW